MSPPFAVVNIHFIAFETLKKVGSRKNDPADGCSRKDSQSPQRQAAKRRKTLSP
jgi:hypothetical protein